MVDAGEWVMNGLNRVFGRIGVLAAVVCGLLGGTLSQAQTSIPASPTTIVGTTERLISYRHQNHMWQTADGATHALINVGALPGGRSLRMYTSIDNGVNWVGGLEIDNTGDTATSDGVLVGNTLHITYSTVQDGVAYSQLAYSAASRNWSVVGTESAFQSVGVMAINPALARDQSGRIWLAFTSQVRLTGVNSIKMVRRGSASAGWIDTGFTFGASDSISIERSARPVAIPGGVGMVYTVHKETYWAKRSNSAPVGQAWASKLIYTNLGTDTDPFGSHYSVAVDTPGNVHLAMVDGGKLLYFRLLASATTWTKKVMTPAIKANYVQTALSAGSVMLVTNANSTLWVYQSSDQGTVWRKTHVLTHDTGTDVISYDRPRMEVPTVSLSPVPLLQQYSEAAQERAMSFQVPVVP
jgi:hypothetical protein